MQETVAILGASDKAERFAHKALVVLVEKGHIPLPVNPNHDTIDGHQCIQSLADYKGTIDTVTVYVQPSILRTLVDDIVAVHPDRVILNPGTEDDAVIERLRSAGIRVQIACTLVLLNTNQYVIPVN